MRAKWLATLSFLACAAAGSAAGAAESAVVVRSAKGEFQDVKQRVLEAIEARGLVVNYTARIGAMLERTGRDIGATRRPYSQAELLEFCSARYSRDAMEADPRNIAFCPYSIAVYTLPDEPGAVYVAYRPPAAFGSERSREALRAVAKLLADIVGDALR